MGSVLAVLAPMACALLLTIAFELPLGMLFVHGRTWREAQAIALAQVVTNPSVQLACIASGWSLAAPFPGMPWLALVVAEVLAVVVEALLYRVADITEHPWTMSVVLNVASFALGIALQLVGLP